MKPIFVAGTGTGVGKTLASAILTEAWQADYWKPVQAGNLDYTDAMWVRDMISNPRSTIHPETHLLNTPASPHDAAQKDGITLSLQDFNIPETNNQLLIEGAGGLMVPLNDEDLVIDLLQHLNASVVLVAPQYLGSINHTLLSLEVLQKRNIPVEGLIFNGASYPQGENWILQYSGAKLLGRIEPEDSLNKEKVRAYAQRFQRP